MFSIELYKNLKANFITSQGQTITWGFGMLPETTQQPYIAFHKLDNNEDPQFLCDNHGDSGDYFMQCNIFSSSFGINEVISSELSAYIASLNGTELTSGGDSYILNNVTHSSSPSANALDNGLANDVLAKTINYSKQ